MCSEIVCYHDNINRSSQQLKEYQSKIEGLEAKQEQILRKLEKLQNMPT